MKRFKNILVGVDLSAGDRLVGESVAAPSEHAIEQALLLAKLSGARVTFLYALDVCPHCQHMLLEATEEHTVFDDAYDALGGVVSKAEKLGITAACKVAMGHSWKELIVQVLTCHNDLVVVGTGGHSAVSHVLFGTTGMKLFRKCPCPVWITKPTDRNYIESVLVAHDLSPVGAIALQLGASISDLYNSALHVLHAIAHTRYAESMVSDSVTQTDQKAVAHSQIEGELRQFELAVPPQIALFENDPAEAILKYIEDHQIALLVLGTIARCGLRRVFTGNTAERLLPRIPCSVLAVKPADFVSPIRPCF